jgi:hypothetical protein
MEDESKQSFLPKGSMTMVDKFERNKLFKAIYIGLQHIVNEKKRNKYIYLILIHVFIGMLYLFPLPFLGVHMVILFFF